MTADAAGVNLGRMATTSSVPDYAWSWLQRSRDVVQQVADRLTGEPPGAGFMDTLRPQFSTDAFVRDVVIGVVVEVAFGGRVPARRPSGVSWDRGLTWWAATCAGTTTVEFERRSKPEPPPQPRLFGGDADVVRRPPPPQPGVQSTAAESPKKAVPRLVERGQVAKALRGLLAHEHEGQIPAAAVRALLGQLDPDASSTDVSETPANLDEEGGAQSG